MKNNNSEPKQLQNRTFGLIFSGIFCLLSLFPLLHGGAYREWSLLISAAFAIPALLFPVLLTPLNNLWTRFGQMMHKITNPLLMGLVFFLTVFPTGIMLKLLRKDPMNRKYKPKQDSYWIERPEQSLEKESFDNQF